MSSLRVVDVSAFQPRFDWAQAAREGVHAGVAKRTEGTGLVDAAFDSHWVAMKSAGLVRGAYAFSRWDCGTDPAAEARFFLTHLPPLEGGDFVALDIEDSPARVPARPLSSWALAWLSIVEHELGFKPLLYSGAYFASQWLTDPRLGAYGKWAAAYGPACPELAHPWDSIAMWQHTSQCQCAGASVDESYFFGTLDQLRAYGKPAPHHTPAPAQPHTSGARFLVTRTHMARSKPQRDAVIWTRGGPQWVHRDAVLAGTGKQTAHWVQVIGGGHPIWVWLGHVKAL